MGALGVRLAVAAVVCAVPPAETTTPEVYVLDLVEWT